eukprot:4054713-Prymnesium_polylepis.1
MALLWASRGAIHCGEATQLSLATRFLYASSGVRAKKGSLLLGAARDMPQADADGLGADDPRRRRAGPRDRGPLCQHHLLWAQPPVQTTVGHDNGSLATVSHLALILLYTCVADR